MAMFVTQIRMRVTKRFLCSYSQMLHETAHPDEDNLPKDNVYPFVKAWLEWIPFDDDYDKESGEIPRAIGYNIHAVSLVKDLNFGVALQKAPTSDETPVPRVH